jgi:hypothetical protein
LLSIQSEVWRDDDHVDCSCGIYSTVANGMCFVSTVDFKPQRLQRGRDRFPEASGAPEGNALAQAAAVKDRFGQALEAFMAFVQ